ncbi:hypothetical protein N7539_005030 [Penicillium diatomitis]|uniref:Prolyl endopeptidase n=1 Tax=Penicillium diatomitis TaxID=2819901 RepID=A0A9X0BUM0_9EURO|nr:uncharacterized protein N7539_005030 [Penicillium diatomitis]KAJ5485042.1 hypothetical protein N7539_005030 [Penicillium diatomitis]
MSQHRIAPYGHWKSPLTAEGLATCSIMLNEVAVDETSGAIYSVECRPVEDGRAAIVRHGKEGQSKDVLPKELSALATVQEMGGGSIAMRPDGQVLFSDEESCNIYLLDPTSSEVALVLPAEKGIRYADFSSHPTNPRWVIAIKEDHREATPETQATNVHNTLVAIDVKLDPEDPKKEITIAHGDDFYSHPKFDPSGKYVSWIQWTHPDMPWTGTVLYVAEWQECSLVNVTRIAGKAQEESIAQPKWGLDGNLFFASDKTGFWQLYSYDMESCQTRAITVSGMEHSDFAVAEWLVGECTYVPLDEKIIAATVITHATSKIILVDTATCSAQKLDLPYVDVDSITRISPTSFAVVGSSKTSPQELSLVSFNSSLEVSRKVLTSTASFELGPEFVSIATEYTAPQKYGPLTDGEVHMFFFAPRNPDYQAEDGALPPLLTYVHGGPNGAVTPALSLEIQYWTTRGFAVCAVNYTGSVAFGREYRERLSGYWGLVDVGDAVSAVEFLANKGLIDGNRIGIYGGSAGGYLTLRALHMYPETWAAGISSYGISDVKALQADSYKFESQDVDRLLLSKTKPEEWETELKSRSPCYFAEQMKAPLLMLQGTEDKIVPIAQARMMAEAMHSKGRVAEVVEFEGEGHGWHGKKAIFESYTRKEDWWKQYLT